MSIKPKYNFAPSQELLNKLDIIIHELDKFFTINDPSLHRENIDIEEYYYLVNQDMIDWQYFFGDKLNNLLVEYRKITGKFYKTDNEKVAFCIDIINDTINGNVLDEQMRTDIDKKFIQNKRNVFTFFKQFNKNYESSLLDIVSGYMTSL